MDFYSRIFPKTIEIKLQFNFFHKKVGLIPKKKRKKAIT